MTFDPVRRLHSTIPCPSIVPHLSRHPDFFKDVLLAFKSNLCLQNNDQFGYIFYDSDYFILNCTTVVPSFKLLFGNECKKLSDISPAFFGSSKIYNLTNFILCSYCIEMFFFLFTSFHSTVILIGNFFPELICIICDNNSLWIEWVCWLWSLPPQHERLARDVWWAVYYILSDIILKTFTIEIRSKESGGVRVY